jgi:hypothetical protein
MDTQQVLGVLLGPLRCQKPSSTLTNQGHRQYCHDHMLSQYTAGYLQQL